MGNGNGSYGTEVEKKTTERWEENADMNLNFAGLFSVAVAILLAVTVQDLKPNSQDTATFHLNNIQQVPTGPNSPRASISSDPPLFYAIWVNTCFVLSSLNILFDSLLATLSKQWARRYTAFTQQPRCSPTTRARVRAFSFEGVDKSRIFCVVEALQTLLHLSVYLLIMGPIVWLFKINQPVFCAVIFLVALLPVAYLRFTSSPFVRPNIPFYSPFSPIIWSLYSGMSYVVFNVLSSSMFGASRRFDASKKDYRNRISGGIGKTAEKIARELSSEIDVRNLISTLDGLREDDAHVKFFEAIPNFFNSEHVNLLQNHLLEEFRIKFHPALTRFLDRTLSSNLVPESVKSSQLIVCLDAAHEVLGPDGVSQILYDILNGRWRDLLQSVEMAASLRHWSNEKPTHYAHFVLSIIIQVVLRVRERNDHWISLVVDEFGVLPSQVLRANISHRDSLSLALLIHITRQRRHDILSDSWKPIVMSYLTKFNIRNALRELPREFCALWDELVREAWRDGPDSTSVKILRELRHAYIVVHHGADGALLPSSAHANDDHPALADPRSYRLCQCVPQEQTLVISVG